jgi:MFS family permease
MVRTCRIGLTLGYLASVGGTVNTILGKIYPDTYPNSNYSRNITSIVFAGTVLGQLVFGYLSDKVGRKFGMVSATVIVVLFSILSAGAYGAGGSTDGMLAALAAYRFFLGIGIGAEYPAGSVAASEATSEAKKGHRHALFVMVTNFVIDFGFVLGGFVPLVLLVFTNLMCLLIYSGFLEWITFVRFGGFLSVLELSRPFQSSISVSK